MKYDFNNFNLNSVLPNKFFEFIMAGLCVFSTGYEEVGDIIKQYKCGIYFDDANLRQNVIRLNQLSSEEIDQIKMNSLKTAKELNGENEMKKFEEMLGESLNSKQNGARVLY